MRIVIAEDQVLLREGLARLFTDRGFDIVAAVGDAEALRSSVDQHRPDLAVVDIRMPPTRHDDPLAALSERERDVLALMAEGLNNPAITRRLVVSERTVEGHVQHLLLKLNLAESDDGHRRVLAVLTYLRRHGGR